MRQLLRESIVLSYDELRILLQSQEIYDFYGFCMGDHKLKDEEVIILVQKMAEKGFLLYSDEGLVFCSILDKLLRAARYGETVVTIKSSRSELPVICVYSYKNNYVTVENLILWKNSIRISVHDAESLAEYIEDNGYYPINISFTNYIEHSYAESALKEAINSCNVGNGCILDIQVYHTHRRDIFKTIQVYEYGLYLFMTVSKSDTKKYEVFTSQIMRDMILDILGGDKVDIS